MVSTTFYLLLIHSIIGLEKIVQKLIEKGANKNAVNQDNNSALILAIKNGNALRTSNHQMAFSKKKATTL